MSKQDKAIARMLGAKRIDEQVVKIDWKKMKAVIAGLIIAIIILAIAYLKIFSMR